VSSTCARFRSWVGRHKGESARELLWDRWPQLVEKAKSRGLRAELSPTLPGQAAFAMLSREVAKTIKGEALGWLTGIHYLAPSDEAVTGSLCGNETPGCRAGCLARETARMRWRANRNARAWRSALFLGDRMLWRALLLRDVARLRTSALRLGLRAVTRVDGGSDTGEGFRLDPLIRALGSERYDYTKNASRARIDRWSVWSHRGDWKETERVLSRGGRAAAVVFPRGASPQGRTYRGFPLIDGDAHDLRHLELGRRRRPFVVGLEWKGLADPAESADFIEGGVTC
jgi:hypothetical protein